ncbi:MAG TPA: M15 family metallopeptidase [Polyangiaceae bacterium]
MAESRTLAGAETAHRHERHARGWGGGAGSASAEPVSAMKAPPEPALPAKLTCLARWYGGRPFRSDAGWALRLENGFAIPFDDGSAKSFEQRLSQPDLEDMFHDAYDTDRGPTLVTEENLDPGRYRVEELFQATYGADANAVRANLVKVKFLDSILQVHSRVAPALERVGKKLETHVKETGHRPAILSRFSGTFNWRTIAGSEQLSAHSYGIAVDLDSKAADYWRWSDKRVWHHPLPPAIVRAFEEEGFIWGGRWYHFDTMHFEYRPEMLDTECWR